MKHLIKVKMCQLSNSTGLKNMQCHFASGNLDIKEPGMEKTLFSNQNSWNSEKLERNFIFY